MLPMEALPLSSGGSNPRCPSRKAHPSVIAGACDKCPSPANRLRFRICGVAEAVISSDLDVRESVVCLPGQSGYGEHCSAPAVDRFEQEDRSSAPAESRPTLLGTDFKAVAKLEIRPTDRSARYCREVASSGIQTLLVMEVTPQRWKAMRQPRTPRSDSTPLPREPQLGSTTHQIRTGPSRLRCRRINGRKVHQQADQATIADLADIPGQSCQSDCCL